MCVDVMCLDVAMCGCVVMCGCGDVCDVVMCGSSHVHVD